MKPRNILRRALKTNYGDYIYLAVLCPCEKMVPPHSGFGRRCQLPGVVPDTACSQEQLPGSPHRFEPDSPTGLIGELHGICQSHIFLNIENRVQNTAKCFIFAPNALHHMHTKNCSESRLTLTLQHILTWRAEYWNKTVAPKQTPVQTFVRGRVCLRFPPRAWCSLLCFSTPRVPTSSRELQRAQHIAAEIWLKLDVSTAWVSQARDWSARFQLLQQLKLLPTNTLSSQSFHRRCLVQEKKHAREKMRRKRRKWRRTQQKIANKQS